MKWLLIPFLLIVCTFSFTAKATAPDAILTITAASNDGAVSLYWDAPSASPVITDYVIYYRSYGSSTWTTFPDGVSTLTSATVTGLTNGTYYEFKVGAVNADGETLSTGNVFIAPLPQTFSDTFEGLSLGNVNGQGGWVLGGGGSYTVQNVDGSKVLGLAGGGDCFATNYAANQVPGGATNTRIKVDIKIIGNNALAPAIWQRREALSNNVGGYLAYRDTDNRLYVGKHPSGFFSGCSLTQMGGAPLISSGSWYTFEYESVSQPNGSVLFNLFVYPQGGSRGAPIVSGSENNISRFLNGSFALGSSGGNVVYYDNLYVYSIPSLPFLAPYASNVSISASSVAIGGTLSGSYTYGDLNSDAENGTTFRWLRADSSNGAYTEIPGENTTSYVLTQADEGKYIKFEVTPRTLTAPTDGLPALSASVGPVSDNEHWHFLLTGDGVSTGEGALNAISFGAYSTIYMPSDGVEGTAMWLGQLYEGSGENGNVETPASGIATSFFNSDPERHAIIMTSNGHNGSTLNDLKKNSTYYTKGITQATNMSAAVALYNGGIHVPKAVIAYFGHANYGNITATDFSNGLIQLQADYENDIETALSGNFTIPLIIMQTNSALTGEIAGAQLAAHEALGNNVVLAGPTYQFPHNSSENRFTNIGSKASGELVGKVLKKILVDNQAWDPLRPTQITRNGKDITVEFNIPVPPLVVDTTNIVSRPHYGFEFSQTGGNTVSISDVSLIDSNSKVKITLSDIPTGTNQELRYAWTCPQNPGSGRCGDPLSALRVGGNIRDSDTAVSLSSDSTNTPLYNWLVAFSNPITDLTPPAPVVSTKTGSISNFNLSLFNQPLSQPVSVPVSPINNINPNYTGSDADGKVCQNLLPENTILSRERKNNPVNVLKLQWFLRTVGIAPTLPTTGRYLTLTENAVKKFQTIHASDILLPINKPIPTGIVAKLTIRKINSIYCQ